MHDDQLLLQKLPMLLAELHRRLRQGQVILGLRHGQTPHNVDKGLTYTLCDGTSQVSLGKVLSGWTAVGLTRLGREQGSQAGGLLSAWFDQLGIDRATMFVSTLPRADETADEAVTTMAATAPELHLNVVRHRTWLMERNHGYATGRLVEEAYAAWPELLRAKKDIAYPYPGGESLLMVAVRVLQGLVDELPASGEPVVVVAHELLLKVLFELLFAGSLTNAVYQRTIANGSVTAAQSPGDGGTCRELSLVA